MTSLIIIIALVLISLLLHPHFTHAQYHDGIRGGYWFPDSGIEASDINATIFSHLYCAFAQLDPQTNGGLSISPQCASFVPTVRRSNPSVITLLSIGGGNAASSSFDAIAGHPSSRETFINSSISLARSHAFDGLDLDWEGFTTPSETSHLATLLTEWRVAVNAEATRTGAPTLILSAAVAYTPRVNPQTSLPAQVISASLNWINVMAYDFYNPCNECNSPTLTRSHSALQDPLSDVSGSSGVRAWISAGVPAEKLVLGFPYYGYAWKLVDPHQHGLLAPADGPDTSLGSYVLRYSQIRQFIAQRGATVVYDPTYVTNYCYSGTTWIGYDDTQSISAKVSYAKTNGLLGYFAWHVAQDYNWTLSTQAMQTWEA